MADRLYAMGSKAKILAIEKQAYEVELIRRVATSLGFEVRFCNESAEALSFMQQRFYQMVICSPELVFGNTSNFIGNIRATRGYERVPILILSSEKEAAKAASYLDEGADGYIIRPFTEEILYSHLNLFLRRQIFNRFQESEYLKKDLNSNRGEIVLCSTSRDILDFPLKGIETDVVVVCSEDELFRTLFSKNIWLVLIGVKAKWALPLVGKIKNEEAFSVQIILLRNSNVLENEVVDFFNQGGDDITSVNKPYFIFCRQINSRIEREMYYKEKYINALITAASKLPIRSENNLNLQFGHWKISAFHESHEQVPGGDFYEVITVDEDRKILVIGDVMGKKWGAWFFSLAYLGYIRSATRNLVLQRFADPSLVLAELNEAIFRDFKLSEVFTTLNILLIHRNQREIEFASAGGLPILMQKASNRTIQAFQARGNLLGLDENETYERMVLSPEDGDRAVLFTDGYIEGPSKEQLLGIQTLAQCMELAPDVHVAEKLDEAMKEKMGSRFDDDRTLITLVYDPQETVDPGSASGLG